MSTNFFTTDSGLAAPASSSTTARSNRYHPALVALHWLTFLLIFGAFFLVQENEGDGERFRPRQGNFPPQGIQQPNPPSQDFDSDEAPQLPPQSSFPRQGESQNIGSG